MNLKKIFEDSIRWRYGLVSDHEMSAMRLVAGLSDGIEGVLVEQYGEFVLCTIYNFSFSQYAQDILDVLNAIIPNKSILIKSRAKLNSNDFFYLNNSNYCRDSIYYCFEEDTQYEIHCDPRHDYGLYLDTKSSREFVRNNSKGKNVLNLFSYTCAFGLAAMKGGAAFTTNIDPNKDYLNWGRKNSERNGVIYKCYPDTTQGYLARHLRRLDKGNDIPYDFTIVDPPAFLVGRGSDRLARNMWPEWMKQLKDSMCPEFLIIINDKSLGRDKNLYDFFIQGLGHNILISPLKQSFDVIGQQLTDAEDSYYFNPLLFHIKR